MSDTGSNAQNSNTGTFGVRMIRSDFVVIRDLFSEKSPDQEADRPGESVVNRMIEEVPGSSPRLSVIKGGASRRRRDPHRSCCSSSQDNNNTSHH